MQAKSWSLGGKYWEYFHGILNLHFVASYFIFGFLQSQKKNRMRTNVSFYTHFYINLMYFTTNSPVHFATKYSGNTLKTCIFRIGVCLIIHTVFIIVIQTRKCSNFLCTEYLDSFRESNDCRDTF